MYYPGGLRAVYLLYTVNGYEPIKVTWPLYFSLLYCFRVSMLSARPYPLLHISVDFSEFAVIGDVDNLNWKLPIDCL